MTSPHTAAGSSGTWTMYYGGTKAFSGISTDSRDQLMTTIEGYASRHSAGWMTFPGPDGVGAVSFWFHAGVQVLFASDDIDVASIPENTRASAAQP